MEKSGEPGRDSLKRFRNLWPQVTLFEYLLAAAEAAARGKRFSRVLDRLERRLDRPVKA